jgi:hypothetical protein
MNNTGKYYGIQKRNHLEIHFKFVNDTDCGVFKSSIIKSSIINMAKSYKVYVFHMSTKLIKVTFY